MWPVEGDGFDVEQVESKRTTNDHGRSEPGVERVECEPCRVRVRRQHDVSAGERTTDVDGHDIHPEESGQEGVVHGGCKRHTHLVYLSACSANKEQYLGDKQRHYETKHAFTGDVAQNRQHHVHDELDGESRDRYKEPNGGDELLHSTELEHYDSVCDVARHVVRLV